MAFLPRVMSQTNNRTFSSDSDLQKINPPIDLSVDLAPGHRDHLWLKNPVMIASGTFGYDGYGRGITPEMDLSQLGAVLPKTVTWKPREGNPEPRWDPPSYRRAWEEGQFLFLNSIGLANPGIEKALDELAPQWTKWGATVLFSISGESVGQFGEMAGMTQGVPGFQAIELNLSCPNIENGALFSHSATLTAAAVEAVKAKTSLPVLAKLAPNIPDITEIAVAAVQAGADALTISNTIPALRIDLDTRRPVLGAGTGGLSGHGLRPISIALVYRAAQAVDVPIIGVGGVFDAKHVVEYLLAGATAAQVGSANLVGLQAPWRILDELQQYMLDSGCYNIRELIGAALPAPTS